MTIEYKDKEGRYRTRSLFYETIETSVKPEYTPVYTLKPQDHKTFKSMKKVYMKCGDLTEYSAALELLGSWEHWQKLCECSWFKPYLETWREELEIKTRSDMLRSLINVAVKEGVKGQGAAKYIANGEYKPQKRGRPSKEEVQRQIRVDANIETSIKEDLERMGLSS